MNIEKVVNILEANAKLVKKKVEKNGEKIIKNILGSMQNNIKKLMEKRLSKQTKYGEKKILIK